jgi:aryl-alcohol dehydrogenase-like predicted oxidoreductase
MRYRKVGTSDFSVSEISLGTGDTAGGIVYGSPHEQIELVSRALALGVNLFDCSPDYGKGLGEANLGRVLKELRANEAKVITKVEIMPEEFAAGRVGAKIKQSVDDSLLRLQRNDVDVIMLHNPVRLTRDPSVRVWMHLTPDDVLNLVMPALQQVKAAGKARLLGLACESSETAAVYPLLATREFEIINAWYNLANPTAALTMKGFPPKDDYTGLFDAALEFGAGVAVIRPLAGGALTDAILDRGSDGRHALSRGYYRDNPGALAPELERGRRFKVLSRAGQTLSAAAYRYVIAHPAVCTVIGGFSSPAQLEESAQASDAGPLSAEDMAHVSTIHARGFLHDFGNTAEN